MAVFRGAGLRPALRIVLRYQTEARDAELREEKEPEEGLKGLAVPEPPDRPGAEVGEDATADAGMDADGGRSGGTGEEDPADVGRRGCLLPEVVEVLERLEDPEKAA